MAHDCFRNTKELENMHALGQINDPEMKLLMIEAVDRTYDLLMDLCSPRGAEIKDDLKQRDKVPEWNDPEPMIFRHLAGSSKSRLIPTRLQTPLTPKRCPTAGNSSGNGRLSKHVRGADLPPLQRHQCRL